MSKEDSIFQFDHENDITIGRGRIVYSTGGIEGGRYYAPGWVLPGGGRTIRKETAQDWARWIDRESRRRVSVGMIG